MKAEYLFSLINYKVEKEDEKSKIYAKETVDEKGKGYIHRIYFSKTNRLYYGLTEVKGEKAPQLLTFGIREHRSIHEQMKELGWLIHRPSF